MTSSSSVSGAFEGAAYRERFVAFGGTEPDEDEASRRFCDCWIADEEG